MVKSHLYVTLHTKMPAVLVEMAFLTNPNDLALLGSPAWRQKVAQEIADGIGEYVAALSGSEPAATVGRREDGSTRRCLVFVGALGIRALRQAQDDSASSYARHRRVEPSSLTTIPPSGHRQRIALRLT